MTLIVGIDCATKFDRIGIARGTLVADGLTIDHAAQGDDTLVKTLADWCSDHDRVLLALDAPLGWPQPLVRVLRNHRAGRFLETESNRLFSRETDRVIRRELGKRPLEVGADRIARTASSALKLLHDLGNVLGAEIPLAWGPDFAGRHAAIEVYPAATFRARGRPLGGYKRKDQRTERAGILSLLDEWLGWTADAEAGMLASADALDAAISVLAGKDFMEGLAVGPTDRDLAAREGWIWAPRPGFGE